MHGADQVSGSHSVLSPSKAARLTRCVGSLAACKGIEDKPSEYAAEGTAYHEISAVVLALGGGSQCADHTGTTIRTDGFAFTIDEENAAHAQTYVDAIRRLPGRQYYEVRLDTSAVVGVPGQDGTADAITLDFEHDTIHVDDLKFGRGEVVHAFDNEQLLIYGAAALAKFDLEHEWKFLKIAIHQPRVNHYSEMTYAVDKVEEFVQRIRPVLQHAHRLYENPPEDLKKYLTPSEKACRWCPIKGSCSARTGMMLAQFPVTPVKEEIRMTDGELAQARSKVDDIEAWCAAIKEEAHMRAMQGRQLPGWKLVDGRKGNRKWGDAKAAETELRERLGPAYTYKPLEIISPADADKAFKKLKADFGLMAPFIVQSEGSKSLVREESPKTAVSGSIVEFPLTQPTPRARG